MIARGILILIGSVFLITGLLKVIYSRPFILHVRNLGILPRALNEISASVFIQAECGVGVALLLQVFSSELIPVLFALIVGLSALTAWGVHSGRVEDCGCYGGWLNLDLKQSLGLNAVYLILLTVAWWTLGEDPPLEMWKVLFVIVVFALCNFLVRKSANDPLLDISPLKMGRKWNRRWSNFQDVKEDEVESVLYIFMSHNCFRCKDWDPYILNLLQQTDLPTPVLIFPDIDSEPENRLKNVSLRVMRPGKFRFLVYRTPTAVLVKNGLIEGKWVAHFPEAYI